MNPYYNIGELAKECQEACRPGTSRSADHFTLKGAGPRGSRVPGLKREIVHLVHSAKPNPCLFALCSFITQIPSISHRSRRVLYFTLLYHRSRITIAYTSTQSNFERCDDARSNAIANSQQSLALSQQARAAQEPTVIMSDITLEAAMDTEAAMRQLNPHWNAGMIAASIAISFLGAFTSTQLFVPYQYL